MLECATQLCFTWLYSGIAFIVTSAVYALFLKIYTAHCIWTQHTIMCIRDVFANVETEFVHIFRVVVCTRQLFVHILYKHM